MSFVWNKSIWQKDWHKLRLASNPWNQCVVLCFDLSQNSLTYKKDIIKKIIWGKAVFPVLWNVLKFYYSRMIQVAFKGVYLGGHWASGRGGNDLVWFPPLRPNYFPISWQSFYFRFQVVDLNITKPLWHSQALYISCFSINQWMHVFVAGRSCVVLWRRCKIPRTTNYITIRTGGSLMVCYFRPDESPALKLPFVGSLRACSMHRFQGRCNPKAE